MKQLDSPGRRRVLGWAVSPMCAVGLGAASLPASAAVPTDTITVLYRRDSDRAPTRLDPVVMEATRAVEDEFARRSFRVLQPSAQTYAALDAGPAVLVTFAPDAGFSMLFSAQVSHRPMPGVDKGLSEVILQCKVYVGHTILIATDGRGMMAASTEADTAEFARRRAGELAAQRAAAQLADKVVRRLKALAPEEIERLTRLTLANLPTIQVIAPPPDAPPVAAPGAGGAAPATSPSDLPGGDGPLPPPARRFALVVAVSNYAPVRQRMGKGPGDLPGVAVDRRNMEGLLASLDFPKDHVTVLADDQATSASLREQLGRLVARTRADDLVLISISAHGAPAQEVPSGFGMPVLSDYGADNRNALDFWQLQSLVGNLPARRAILLIDTCHAGGATGLLTLVVTAAGPQLQAGQTAPDPSRVAQAHGTSGRSLAVVAASRADQLSLEDKAGGGIFTRALVSALKEQRGQTIEKIFRQQVEQRVIEESRVICKQMRDCKEQTPLFGFSGRGNMITL